MKILLDANTPAPLANYFGRHEVTRTDELGWQGLSNGALLKAAEKSGFAVLLTCDQNMLHQQNLTGRQIGIVVLSTNHWPTLQRVAARIAAAVDFAKNGQVRYVDIESL